MFSYFWFFTSLTLTALLVTAPLVLGVVGLSFLINEGSGGACPATICFALTYLSVKLLPWIDFEKLLDAF